MGLLDFDLGLLVGLFLGLGHTVELMGHFFDLFGLSMVDIGLPRDVLVALFDLNLGVFVLFCHIPLCLLCFRQLNFNVAERVLKLLVFDFAKAQHLPVFNLRAFLAFHAETFAHNSFLLAESWVVSEGGCDYLLSSLQSPFA